MPITPTTKSATKQQVQSQDTVVSNYPSPHVGPKNVDLAKRIYADILSKMDLTAVKGDVATAGRRVEEVLHQAAVITERCVQNFKQKFGDL